MIRGTLGIQTGNMTEAEAGIDIIVEDLGGVEMRVDLEIEMGLTLKDKSE